MPVNQWLSVKMKTTKLHKIELTEYEYEFLLNNLIISQGCIPRPLGAFPFFVKDFDTPLLAAG